MPTGKVKIEIETRYVALRPGGPLKITMKAAGKVVAEGEVPISAPLLFTANDCLDIGWRSDRRCRSTITTRCRSSSTARSSRST